MAKGVEIVDGRRRIVPAGWGTSELIYTIERDQIFTRLLLFAAVASIHLIEIWDEFEALADDEEKDNDHENPVHAFLLLGGLM